jgi:ATP-binding cassette, subfamily B (MDR/TAP), member 1
MLRNEVGWFDEEENSADALSMRLANDATFVRAAFSNRLSIFIQDFAAVAVALLIGMLLQWRVALIALSTVPVLIVSAVAQVGYDVLLLCSFYQLYFIIMSR